ncbi:FAD-binding oxidoreductase [Coleofasciculus chthonoplastes]|uniref:FAD-binding oxidoreductase n=1 Tax=Coleofasciculus chthonoplastes TaxID=64178 RepID=UPI0032FD379B
MIVKALDAWRNILSTENVLTDTATVSAAQTATFATKQRVLALIRPGNRAEVQECVRIANEYQTPIYPISCGKNWGLGSRVPVQDNCVILDLSRLNQIVDYNEKLAYITVEPGVTFRQAYDYLREQKSNLFLSVIGGSPDASLIGNTLERGDGFGPHGDRLDHVCELEVILPTGECVHSGFGRFANAKAAKISRWGVGPYFDGIFTQSNLGIVTRMTMWLMPIPKYPQLFTCTIIDASRIDQLIDAVQSLVLQGTIKSNSFSLWNCYKFLAAEGRYPWKKMLGQTPLSLKQLKGAEPWFGNGALYSASREQGLAERKLIEQALEGKVDQLIFSDEDSNELKEDGFIGVPSDQNISSTYWRKKTPIPSPMNPDRDGCGVIWLCPVLPFDGEQFLLAIKIIELIFNSYHFEPNIGLSFSSGRSIHVFIAIIYDRDVAGEDQRAMECHDKILHSLIQEGYIPYRLGIQSMNSLPPTQDDYGKLISTLKRGLDPNNILAPGRYDFRSEWFDTNY